MVMKAETYDANILATFRSFLLVPKYKMLGNISDVYWSDFLFLYLWVDTSNQVLLIRFWKHVIDFQTLYILVAMFKQPHEKHFLSLGRLLFVLHEQ